MYYAQKQFLVKVSGRVKEDGWLKTQRGDMRVKNGDIILTDYNDNQFVTTDDFFKEDYVPVKVIDIDKEKMARGYEEMSEINKEEANASINTYDDGMGFYKE